MAPHAGTTGLKVLLAGTSQLDLGEAQAFLSGEGAAGMFCSAFILDILASAVLNCKLTRHSRCIPTVTTSFCHRETVKLLQSDDFDVAVVEVRAHCTT